MRTSIRKLFITQEQKSFSVYFWTVLSGLAYSGSTFLMFWLVAGVCGSYQGGIFTIALTIGNQLLTIGYFNVRTYQVSDVEERFSFGDYLLFRIICCILMAVIGIAWIGVGNFTTERMIAIALMLVFKIAEAVADVMEGLYQQKNRYDVTGKCIFWETIGFLGTFTIVLLLTRSLVHALAAMTVVYILMLLVIDCNLVGAYAKVKLRWNFGKQKSLFLATLPLFVNSFLLMYINNAAKYAIDAAMGEEALAYFNYIFMPAFVINLLGGFLIKPALSTMALRYHDRDRTGYFAILKRQTMYLLALTVICLAGGWLLGIPVLSFFYQTDLTQYRRALCILILGGAFTAVYTMLQYSIVIMRHQYAGLIGCTVTAGTAVLIMPLLARNYGIDGGAWGYFILMTLMSAVYLLMNLYYMKKDWKVENHVE